MNVQLALWASELASKTNYAKQEYFAIILCYSEEDQD